MCLATGASDNRLVRSRVMWLLLVVLLVVVALVFAAEAQWLAAGIYVVFGALLSWWIAPFRGRNALSHAQIVAGQGQSVVIYWRPGCVFCARLRRRLGRLGRSATWINIHRDGGAAAFVRGVNHGNETVPTVVVDGEARTNPPPNEVREALLVRR